MKTLVTMASVPVLLLASCICGFDLQQSAKSPDRKVIVEVTEVDCGATIDFAQHVEIRRNRWLFQDQQQLVVLKGQPKIKICWFSDSELAVIHSKAEAFHRLDTWNAIEVWYVGSDEPDLPSCDEVLVNVTM